MQTVIKQAICVSVLQICSRVWPWSNIEISNDKQTRTHLLRSAALVKVDTDGWKGSALPQKRMIKCPKNYK